MDLIDVIGLKKSHLLTYKGQNKKLKEVLETNEEGPIKGRLLITDAICFKMPPVMFNSLAFELLEGERVLRLKSRVDLNNAIYLWPTKYKLIYKCYSKKKPLFFNPKTNELTECLRRNEDVLSDCSFEDFLICKGGEK